MKRTTRMILLGSAAFAVATAAIVAAATGGDSRKASESEMRARGRYLMSGFGCADCHTPKKFGPRGPEFDDARAFSGHPEGEALPPAPTGKDDGPWIVKTTGGLTAWNGPWGTTFTANLTPDPETGLGKWTPEMFIQTLRTGRRMGHGRPILPPMPWELVGKLTDDDLRAIFSYLQSLPPIKNLVPTPLPPQQAASVPAAPATR